MKKHHLLFSLSFVCLMTVLMSGCNPGTPKAAFSADVTAGTAPLTVTFTDESTIEKSLAFELVKGQMDLIGLSDAKAQTVTGWEWDFGDGDTAKDQNPVHTYGVSGTYSVSLTVTTSSGRTTTETKEDFVSVTDGRNEGEAEEGEMEGEAGEGEAEGEPAEGEEEGEVEEGESEGETAEGEVAVWGDGDNWQEEVEDQEIIENIDPETTVNDSIRLHPIPDTGEYEARLELSNFAPDFAGALYFSEFPSARANPEAKTWHMVTSQYQIRLVEDVAKSTNKTLRAEDARVIMVVDSWERIPEGFDKTADMHVWRAFPGRAVNESGEDIDNVKAWMNLTNGHPNYVWNNDSKGNKMIAASVNFPIGEDIERISDEEFDELFDDLLNLGLISGENENDSVPRWRQNLENNPEIGRAHV